MYVCLLTAGSSSASSQTLNGPPSMCKCHRQSRVNSCLQFWNFDWTRKKRKTESFPPTLHLSIMISSVWSSWSSVWSSWSSSAWSSWSSASHLQPVSWNFCSVFGSCCSLRSLNHRSTWKMTRLSGIVKKQLDRNCPNFLTLFRPCSLKCTTRKPNRLNVEYKSWRVLVFFSFWRLCGNESSIEQYSRSQSRTGKTWELQLKIVVEFHRFPINLYKDTKKLRWEKSMPFEQTRKTP